jgi:hypothetical protein
MKHYGALAILVLVALSVSLSVVHAESPRGRVTPPRELTVYGRTLWNVEALLHDTFGKATACLRLRDYQFVSATCGDLADYGYWKNIFVGARHSHFKLVHRSRAPALGNVVPIRVKGLYVFCGKFPVAFAPIAHPAPHGRWLVLLHGWANLPFTCF